MENEVFLRLGMTIAIVAAGLLVYRLVTILVLARASRTSAPVRSQKPAILYFTTPDCAPCRTVQRPAIMQTKHILGEKIEVVEINAQEQPDLARQWGILSVPTTFILDRNGKPVHVNHGVTPAKKLLRQIRDTGI